MKIIISHSQKQHVYRMVYGVKKNKKLTKFFTSLFFADDSLLTKILKLITKTKQFVVKRSFLGIQRKDVFLTLVPEIFFRITKLIMPQMSSYYMDRLHDNIVSYCLSFYEYDMVIGYERQSLRSFKKAKRKGKTTILDLASIHSKKQREINQKYNNVLTGFNHSLLLEKEKLVKGYELEYTDYVITLSEFAKDSCIEAGIPKDKIFSVHLGIDVDEFTQKKNYDSDSFEILYVGGMRYSKGIKDIIETFKQLNLSNAVLTLVGGEGDALEYVLKHIGPTIHYVPFMHHNNLKNVYERASVFILPSYMDSWGQVVCEAMACGTPVIVSENTGAKDIIENGENGFIVGVADQNKLSEKILYYYENRDELERMGLNAYKSVQHLTWESYYGQINRILERLKES